MHTPDLAELTDERFYAEYDGRVWDRELHCHHTTARQLIAAVTNRPVLDTPTHDRQAKPIENIRNAAA